MPTSTEVAIATTTLSSAASTITFSSIPATYTDLRLVIVGTASANDSYVGFRFNSDSATNYSRTWLYGDGASAISSATTGATAGIASQQKSLQTSTPSFYTIDVFSYAGSTYKTTLCTASTDLNGSGVTVRNVNLWRSTSAITRIDLITSGVQTYSAGTTATLYGIL